MNRYEQEAAFEWWLHDKAGYSYIGPTSYYRLTLPELNRLYKGFQTVQEEQRKQQERDHPELRGKRVRDSDKRALKRFKDDYGFD